jgi:NRPS condensation-like uncharacterized protein
MVAVRNLLRSAVRRGRQRHGFSVGDEGQASEEGAPPTPAVGPYPDLGGSFTPLYQRLLELGVASRITEFGKIGPRGRSADFAVDDPEQFIKDVRNTGRCCTDTPLGRILHPGKISLRENRVSYSLHLAIGAGGRVLAHLDRLSPLVDHPCGEICRYSLLRVLAHNTARLWGDLFRSLFGHRLDCAPLLLSLQQVQDAGHEHRDEGHEHRDSRTNIATGPPTPPRPTPTPSLLSPPPTRVLTPFTVIDEAVHILDSPVAPWSVHLEVRVSGPLDENRLRSAVLTALAHHPLARARKAPSPPSARASNWEIPGEPDLDPVRVLRSPMDGALRGLRAAAVSLSVPLAESPPLRIWLVHDPGGDVVLLNVNHAVTDATGGLRLLQSIARAYAGVPDPLPDIDPLGVRDLRGLFRAPDMPSRARRLSLVAGKTRDLVNVPARVAPDGAVDRAGYGIHLARPSEVLTRALVGAGDDKRINDILMAALHLSIALWNIEHGIHCGRISVLTPVNLRPDAWRDEVVGNFSLLTRVLTTPAQRSLGHVVEAVRTQTERREEEQTFAALVEILSASASLPVWLKRAAPALLAVTGNRVVDTAQLAYLGRVDDLPSFGDAGPIQELWFSPPARMPLGLSIGTLVASERLHIALRYRHPLLSEDAACRLADYYLSLLGHLLAKIGPASNPDAPAG